MTEAAPSRIEQAGQEGGTPIPRMRPEKASVPGTLKGAPRLGGRAGDGEQRAPCGWPPEQGSQRAPAAGGWAQGSSCSQPRASGQRAALGGQRLRTCSPEAAPQQGPCSAQRPSWGRSPRGGWSGAAGCALPSPCPRPPQVLGPEDVVPPRDCPVGARGLFKLHAWLP